MSSGGKENVKRHFVSGMCGGWFGCCHLIPRVHNNSHSSSFGSGKDSPSSVKCEGLQLFKELLPSDQEDIQRRGTSCILSGYLACCSRFCAVLEYLLLYLWKCEESLQTNPECISIEWILQYDLFSGSWNDREYDCLPNLVPEDSITTSEPSLYGMIVLFFLCRCPDISRTKELSMRQFGYVERKESKLYTRVFSLLFF